jgi:hypothetical protein
MDLQPFCLIIWEEVPNDTDLFLIPWNVYAENQEVVDAAAGHFINHENDECVLGLMRLIYTAKNGGEDCIGIFDQYKMSNEDKHKPISAPIQRVIWSGFIN